VVEPSFYMAFRENHTPWNKGIPRDKKTKTKISEALQGRTPWNKGKKLHYKVWNKGTKGLCKINSGSFKKGQFTGEKHPMWKGGIENHKRQYKRNDPAYQKWVRLVKYRDNNKCRINNKGCSGYCEVHHILPVRDYPELMYNINNGITLCQAHHPRKRAEEKRLIPFFQGLVPVSNRLICY